MKNWILIILFIFLSTSIIAQSKADTNKSWKIEGKNSLTLSQVTFSNWAAGGESSISANAFANLFINYKNKRSIWENKIELAYGFLMREKSSIKKTDDKIYLSTEYGRKAAKNWYYSFSINFKTQFAKGYQSNKDSILTSKFLSPAYVLGTFGMNYKPNEHFSIMISPVSGRITIVNDDELSDKGAYGVDKGKKMRFEFGGNIEINYSKEIFKNVDLTSELKLFSNFLNEPQNIAIDSKTYINMEINKYLSANIVTSLIYDDDITITDKQGNKGPRTQFKEIIGIGFSYNFKKNK